MIIYCYLLPIQIIHFPMFKSHKKSILFHVGRSFFGITSINVTKVLGQFEIAMGEVKCRDKLIILMF